MKKRGLSLMLAGALAIGLGSTTAFAAPEAVSTQSENMSEGWTPEPQTTLYALDGSTITVSPSQVGDYLNLGWYSIPVTKMYNLDGREMVVDRASVDAFMQEGWYLIPVTAMYALDGRTLVVECEQVDAYLQEGWYLTPVTIMYALDGRTMVVERRQADAYLQEGWYLTPVTTMYALDGRTMVVDCNQVDDYLRVNWYTAPVTQLYAPYGRTIVVAKTEVDDYIRAGWYGMPVTELYAPDGRTMVVPSSDVAAHMQVGWYLRENYFCHVADSMVINYGYSDAVSWLEDAMDRNDITEQEWDTLWTKRSFLLNDWMNAIGCPVAIEEYYVTKNSAGMPEANIMFRNLSFVEMTAYEVHFDCLDAFGELTTDYYSGNSGALVGYNYNTSLMPGEEYTYVWELYENTNTQWLGNVYMKSCAFADGSTWHY